MTRAVVWLAFSFVLTFPHFDSKIAAAASTHTQTDKIAVKQVLPHVGAVAFQQVTFQLAAGTVEQSDWGQVQVNPKRLRLVSGFQSGYVNVLIYPEGSRYRTPSWAVENLYVPLTNGLTSASTAARFLPTPPALTCYLDFLRAQPSLSSYLDLRPGVEGQGRVRRVLATVLVTGTPLPTVIDIVPFMWSFQPHLFTVEQIMENAEGDQSGQEEEADAGGPPSSVVVPPSQLIGLPPPETVPLPFPPSDFNFPKEVFQEIQMNVDAATNQCVPMAHANVLQYLEDRYHAVPWVWIIPDRHVDGYGKVSVAGDVLFWEPIPEDSLVANIDVFARRPGVKHFGEGDTTSRCAQIRGIFGYLADRGDFAKATYRHQGGDEKYGAGEECDTIDTIPLGSFVSEREGGQVTWAWVFDQLVQGRGVVMSFSRYDINGNWKSGHMVRVYGAAEYNAKQYLYTQDDARQGYDFSQIPRTQPWEVADTRGPAAPGIPNGRLEMGKTNWEINFAMSAEAHPTLAIP